LSRWTCASRTGGVVHFEDVHRRLLLEAEFVETDDRLLAGVNLRLTAGRGLLDAELRDAGLDGLGHYRPSFRFPAMWARAFFKSSLRQTFDVVAAAPRHRHLADAGLVLEVELGVTGDAAGEKSVGKRDGLVEGVWCGATGCARQRPRAPRDRAGKRC